jgi:hypothetical protein
MGCLDRFDRPLLIIAGCYTFFALLWYISVFGIPNPQVPVEPSSDPGAIFFVSLLLLVVS